MKTACFHTAGTHPNAVSIARFGPRWMRFPGPRYPALAPTPAMLKMDAEHFDVAYRAQLAALDPRKVYLDLVALVGIDALLLCHEKPGVPCHRLIAGRWLEAALGIEAPELDAPVTTAGHAQRELPPTDAPDAVRRYLAEQLHLDLDRLGEDWF